MLAKLLVLMLAPFAFGTGAYVFVGLLDPMAVDLEVSVPLVGQLQSAFAIAAAVGGPVLAVLTNRYDRRALLIVVLLGLSIANAASALAGTFPTLMIARVAAGLVGTLTLPVALAIGVTLVAPEKRPVAIATVFSGTALSFLIGIPLGSFVGGAYGWPASFWLGAALAAAAALGVALVIPRIGQLPAPPEGALQAATRPPAIGLLTVTFMSFFATFTSVAFIGPLITALTALQGGDVGLMQLFVGVGGLLGLTLGARLAGGFGLRALTPLMVVVLVTQLTFTVGLLRSLTPAAGMILTASIITAGAGAVFGLSPIIQAALAEIAGPAATIAFALNGSVVFLGQGFGALLGGWVIAETSLTWTGTGGALVALVSLLVTQRLRSFQFELRRQPTQTDTS